MVVTSARNIGTGKESKSSEHASPAMNAGSGDSRRVPDKAAETTQKQHGLQMEFNHEINRIIVYVTDRKTGESISQIPTEEMVEFMRNFGDFVTSSSEGKM
jgi:uncharacterized FlaG/YvyC family protein